MVRVIETSPSPNSASRLWLAVPGFGDHDAVFHAQETAYFGELESLSVGREIQSAAEAIALGRRVHGDQLIAAGNFEVAGQDEARPHAPAFRLPSIRGQLDSQPLDLAGDDLVDVGAHQTQRRRQRAAAAEVV